MEATKWMIRKRFDDVKLTLTCEISLSKLQDYAHSKGKTRTKIDSYLKELDRLAAEFQTAKEEANENE